MPPEKEDLTEAAEREHIRRLRAAWENREEKERTLLANLKSRKAELFQLLASCSDHWGYEDPVYRFYHGSFKVFALQSSTEKIVAALHSLLPEQPLDDAFLQIIAEGTGHKFTLEMNADWLRHTRPIVEAFFHARYMLEMAVRYADLEPPSENRERFEPGDPRRLEHLEPIPSGWAAFLSLFNLR
jgi:hypothetical protein